MTQDQIESLSEIMHQAVQQEQIAGGSFLVAHKGEIVFREAFGYADLVFHGGAFGAHFRIDRRRELVCVFLVHQNGPQVLDLKNKLVDQVYEMFPVY